MEEWKKYKLGELLSIRYGKDHKKLNDGIIPVYGSGGIMRYVNQSIYDSPSILIPRKGSLNNIIYTETPFWTVDTMFWTIVNTKLADPKYLYYAICKFDFAGLNVGSAVPSLTVPIIGNINIILPSLNKQKNIVNILSILDNKIELNHRINANLEQQAQALFKSWFVDFEPFKDGKFVDSELGMIPEGWKVGTLSDIIKNTISGDWGKEHPQGNHIRKVFCIRGADIPDIKIGNKGNMPTRFILEKNYQSKVLIDGDMVIEISGGSPTQSTGRACRISNRLLDKYNNSIICTNFCKAIKPLSGYSSFLYYIWEMLYNQGVMFSYENGTTGIKNLDINGFIQKEQIIIPPIHIATDFEKMIKVFYDKIQSNGMQSERLAQLRDTLLPKLMSGELKINDFNN